MLNETRLDLTSTLKNGEREVVQNRVIDFSHIVSEDKTVDIYAKEKKDSDHLMCLCYVADTYPLVQYYLFSSLIFLKRVCRIS